MSTTFVASERTCIGQWPLPYYIAKMNKILAFFVKKRPFLFIFVGQNQYEP
jgi:hypothetical protein